MTAPTNPWSIARDHCWKHVEVAKRVADVLQKLDEIPVESIIPIVSASSPSIIITPFHHDSVKHIRDLCVTIRARLDEPNDWRPFVVGMKWSLRLTTTSGIQLDIATSVDAMKSEKEWNHS